jgi:hypothetical protein
MPATTHDEPGVIFPLTPTERVAVVMLALVRGQRLTSSDVARMTGLTTGAALRLLQNISRVAPVYDDEGEWQLLQAADCVGRVGWGV